MAVGYPRAAGGRQASRGPISRMARCYHLGNVTIAIDPERIGVAGGMPAGPIRSALGAQAHYSPDLILGRGAVTSLSRSDRPCFRLRTIDTTAHRMI
jgi:hypothetical protein